MLLELLLTTVSYSGFCTLRKIPEGAQVVPVRSQLSWGS